MTDPQETIAALQAENARLRKMLDVLTRWDQTPEPPRMSLSEIPTSHPPELNFRGSFEAEGPVAPERS